MKINLYREQFKTISFDIKKLSLYNEAELLVLSDEFRRFWKEEEKDGKNYFQIDMQKANEKIKNGEMQEIIDRSVALLNEILDDTEKMNNLELSFNDFFFVIPTLQNEIYSYLSDLKKK